MTFDPTSVEVTCVTLPEDHCVQVPWEYINVCGYSDQFCKLPTKGHWLLDDLWPHICWSLMCDSTQGSLCPSPMKIHQSMWIQCLFLQKTWIKGHWPQMTFDPTSVEVTCVTLPKDHHVQVPLKYIKLCGYIDPLNCKNLNQRSLTPDDLWPHICWGHMCDSTQGSLCPSPMGIHQCMWIQWSSLQITTYIHTTYYILRTESVIT